MKRTIAILTATAVVAVSSLPAIADGGGWRKNSRGMDHSTRHERGMKMLKRADANKDGKITLEEFSALTGERFSKADANGDGTVTKAEIVIAFETMKQRPRLARHAGRMADRLVYRFDLNDDGILALEEIQNQAQKRFALLDRNDDGELVKAEIRRMRDGGHKRHGKRGGRNWHKHGKHGGKANPTE